MRVTHALVALFILTLAAYAAPAPKLLDSSPVEDRLLSGRAINTAGDVPYCKRAPDLLETLHIETRALWRSAIEKKISRGDCQFIERGYLRLIGLMQLVEVNVAPWRHRGDMNCLMLVEVTAGDRTFPRYLIWLISSKRLYERCRGGIAKRPASPSRAGRHLFGQSGAGRLLFADERDGQQTKAANAPGAQSSRPLPCGARTGVTVRSVGGRGHAEPRTSRKQQRSQQAGCCAHRRKRP